MSALAYHEVYGRGSPLVLLSGFAADLQTWTFHRDALAAEHRLILLDNRGAGRSPTADAPPSTASLARDVRDVLSHLGIARASVLGHSLGGAIAQELALGHPEVVERLILVSSFAHGASLPLEVLERWRRALAHGVDEQVMAQQVLPWVYSEAYLAHPHRVRAIVGFLRANRFPPSDAGMQSQLTALVGHDTVERLSQIQAPTLVVCGTSDRLTPLALSREIADKIPGSRLTTLASAGHICMLEQVDAFTEAVLDFCRDA